MKILLHLWARLKRLKWNEIIRLTILSATIFLLSSMLCLLDISVTSLLLDEDGTVLIGADYFLAAFLWLGVAAGACSVKRHQGFGSTRIVLSSILLLGLIWLGRIWHPLISLHFMFASKYGIAFLMNFIFWYLASRYIKISMTSLKYIGVCAFELLGMLFGSVLSLYIPAQPTCVMALIGLVFVAGGIYTLCRLLSVKREVFVKKIGNTQDVEDSVIVANILALSFFWMMGRLLVEYMTYEHIIETEMPVMKTLGTIYGVFAGISLVILACFARMRFLYTMPLGLVACAGSVGMVALGVLFEESWMIFSGFVIFFISSHFYISRYLSLLPHPFMPGKSMAVDKLRLFLIVPCAFVFIGSLLLSIESTVLNWILLTNMLVLAVLFIISGHLYGRQLMKMCALKIWRDGPFLLAYPPLKQMIQQGLSKKNAAEAIYFLSLVDEGYIANYRELLDQMLQHPSVTVRLFVLKKLNKLSLTLKEKRLLSAIMKSDECDEVQNMALSCLIRDAIEANGSMAWHRYKEYLGRSKWALGVCDGFLYGRGVWMNQIIDMVLKLADSDKEHDNLVALKVMSKHPQDQWIEPLEGLLCSSHTAVVKSAIDASGKLAAPLLLNRLLPMLDDIRWRDSVLETLNQYGKQAFPAIEKMILSDAVPVSRQKMLVLFLGWLPSGEGKQMLLRVFFQANRILRQVIVASLKDAGIVWVHKGKKDILKDVISETVVEWYEIYNMLLQAEKLTHEKLTKIKNLFCEALTEELQRTRLLLLEQTGFYALDPLAQQAVEILKQKDFNAYAAAVGCLQDILPKKIYQQIKDILLYPTVKNIPNDNFKMTAQAFFNSFILTPASWVNAWMKALALYGWHELNDKEGLKAVEEGLKSGDWIVLESALFALGRLEKNRQKAVDLTLNVPTRYLLKQNFETLLEDKHVSNN